MSGTHKYVSKLEDLPQTECFVIAKTLTIHTEADERSRTNPGHGYPASTDHYVQIFLVFPDEESFKVELARQVKEASFSVASYPVRGFKLTPYTTKTVVTVEVTPA